MSILSPKTAHSPSGRSMATNLRVALRVVGSALNRSRRRAYTSFQNFIRPKSRTFVSASDILVEREQKIVASARNRDPKGPWFGIALSGGGIRSATFSLGVLQALAAHDLLKHFDYISSVSGGGYISSSLQWWWREHLRQTEENETP